MQKVNWKDVLRLAWPLIIANSFWNLQLTIDRIYLGAFSTEALGASMTVMGVFWVPMALLQQTSAYVSTFIAQYFGANQENRIGAATWHALIISLMGGCAVLGLNFFSSSFFQLVNHSPEIQKLEIELFNSLTFSALPTAVVALASGFFTGIGDTRKVIGINFIGFFINVILDYVMIFGKFGFPQMGVAGAGYATSLASYGSAFYGIYLILNKENRFRFALDKFKFDPHLFKQFLKFGVPSGLQWALEGLAFTVFLIVMGRMQLGDAALSSSSIAVTIMMLAVLPTMGIAQAVMTIVGQSLGEKNPDKAESATYAGIKISLIYMSLMAMSFFLIPEFYLSWFKNDKNPELWTQVTTLAPQILMILGIFILLDSIYLNVSFSLKGAGDTRFVSLVALILPWPLMVLPTYLFREFSNGPLIGWWWAALYALVINIVIKLRFRSGRWKKINLIEN